VVDATRLGGRCLWFDARKNYGAIQPDQPLGIEAETGHSYIFVHGNDVEPGSQPPRNGDAVEFCRGTCPRGRTKAAKVVVTATSSSSSGSAQGTTAHLQEQQRSSSSYYGTQGQATQQSRQQQLWQQQQQQQPSQAGNVLQTAQQQQQQQQQQQAQDPRQYYAAAAAAAATQQQGLAAAASPQQQAYSQTAQQQQQYYAAMNPAAAAAAQSARQAYAPGQQAAAAGAQQPQTQTGHRALGRVKWFDRDRKSYGFITPADGSPDLFMHAGDVLGSTKTLGPGDAVEFDFGVQPQSGRPKALEVVRLVQHVVSDEDEDDGRTTLGKFAPGDEPLFDKVRVTGTIARFDPTHRWGFIAPDDASLKPPNGGDNFFVHGLDVLDADNGDVDVGQHVEFAIVRTRSRRCKAVQVLRVLPGSDDAAEPLDDDAGDHDLSANAATTQQKGDGERRRDDDDDDDDDDEDDDDDAKATPPPQDDDDVVVD